MPLDIDPADRIEEGVAGRLDGAAVERALPLLAGESAAEEGEAQVVIGLRQHRGHAAGGVKGEPVLPRVERLAGDEGGDAADRLGMPGDDPLWPARLAPSKKASQSIPGARAANSPRAQVCTRCGSCAETASTWARAILVRGRRCAARASASGRPIRVSIWPI